MNDPTYPCQIERRNGVTTITLADAPRRNALGLDLVTSLHEIVLSVAMDETCRVVVLTADGPAFSAGWDLRMDRADSLQVDALLVDVLETIRTMPRPVIAKVGGAAVGGALALVAACDLSIASRRATFGFGEARLGLAPTTAAVHCVPKMRQADALWTLLTGERFDADRAVSIGLVNLAVDHDRLDEESTALIQQVMLGGPVALGACKQLARAIRSADTEAYDLARRMNDALVGSDEAVEGVAAYSERRLPRWAPAGAAAERATSDWP